MDDVTTNRGRGRGGRGRGGQGRGRYIVRCSYLPHFVSDHLPI